MDFIKLIHARVPGVSLRPQAIRLFHLLMRSRLRTARAHEIVVFWYIFTPLFIDIPACASGLCILSTPVVVSKVLKNAQGIQLTTSLRADLPPDFCLEAIATARG